VNLTKRRKLTIFILTIWPLAHLAIFIGIMTFFFSVAVASGKFQPHRTSDRSDSSAVADTRDSSPKESFTQMSRPKKIAVAIAVVGFAALFISHLATMLLMLGLPVFYIYYLYKHSPITSDRSKIGWTAALVLFSIFAAPIFYFMYIHAAPATDAQV
jgi:hypothetical protein